MPEPLKYLYNRPKVQALADALHAAYPDADPQQFLALVFDDGWEGRELKQRMRHIALCMRAVLPADYRAALDILCTVAPQFNGFTAIVFCDFVELYGVDDYDASIPALELLTRYSSAEFAVRPFIVRYPHMMQQMLAWAQHDNHHVRRLASEGCRPRLPWGMALSAFKKDPSPVLPILECLKADESDYVRRSVANNLNDIAKDHPEVVLAIAQRWKGTHPDTDRVVRHACRTLLKRAHPEALALFGFGEVDIRVDDLTVPPVVALGDVLAFGCTVAVRSHHAAKLRIEYAIHYVKAGGKLSRKVFALAEQEMAPGGERRFERTQSFRDMTTRRHYPGTHRIEILVNGRKYAEAEFLVQ